MTVPATWETYAVLRADGTFGNVGWQRYCEAHVSERRSESVVPVIVTEVTSEAERTHWSWMDAGDDHPAWSLTWPSEAQFRVCFPYGFEAEAEHGKGRPLWLAVLRSGP